MSINIIGTPANLETNVFPLTQAITFGVSTHQVDASSFIDTNVTATLASLPLVSFTSSVNNSVPIAASFDALPLSGFSATIVGTPEQTDTDVTTSTAVLPLIANNTIIVAGNMSWAKPTALADGSAIPPATITGYKVYVKSGTYSLYDTLVGENNTSISVPAGTYAVATTWATGQSPLSVPVQNGGEYVPTGTTYHTNPAAGLAGWQAAIDLLVPGDELIFDNGTYTNLTNTALNFSAVGTQVDPITIRAESHWGVTFEGDGFKITGSPGGSQNAIWISGDWQIFSDFVIADFGCNNFWAGCRLYGTNNIVEECLFRDNNGGGLMIGADNTAINCLVRNCVAYTNRNFSGFTCRMTGAGSGSGVFVDNCWFEDCVSFSNGYTDKAGTILSPGRPGDADCSGFTKEFFDGDSAGGPGIPISNSGFRRLVGWRGADDTHDWSVSSASAPGGAGGNTGVKAVGNVWFNPGTEGTRLFKVLREGNNPWDCIGNLAFDNSNGTGPGFELRYGVGSDGLAVMNNTVVDITSQAYFLISGSTDSDASSRCRNNMAYQVGVALVNQLANITVSNNHLAGDPEIVDWTMLNQASLDLDDTGLTGKEFHKKVRDQAWKWAMPASESSPLYEGGVLDLAVHMPTADDDSVNPADPEDLTLVHWTGSVPQQGAVPYRFIDPPTGVSIT